MGGDEGEDIKKICTPGEIAKREREREASGRLVCICSVAATVLAGPPHKGFTRRHVLWRLTGSTIAAWRADGADEATLSARFEGLTSCSLTKIMSDKEFFYFR